MLFEQCFGKSVLNSRDKLPVIFYFTNLCLFLEILLVFMFTYNRISSCNELYIWLCSYFSANFPLSLLKLILWKFSKMFSPFGISQWLCKFSSFSVSISSSNCRKGRAAVREREDFFEIDGIFRWSLWHGLLKIRRVQLKQCLQGNEQL